MKRVVVVAVAVSLVVLAFTMAFAEKSGKELYDTVCIACHGTGQLDAPVFGTGDWADLAKKGIDELLKNALSGVGSMPPKGGCSTCTDAEIKAAIQYMLGSVK